MGIILTPTNGSVQPGSYVATFDSIENSSSEYGPGLKWQFTIVSGQASGSRITAFSGNNPTPQNKAGRFLSGVVGKPITVGVAVDIEPFYGQKRLIVVESGEKGGARITSISTLPTA
ncbi:MAG: hypothetical protein K8U57_22815 [Planctomycetes bacterium]|nr:hypothetical protein [Planctomycetota bacterium]